MLFFLVISIIVACTNFTQSERLSSQSDSTLITESSNDRDSNTLEVWWEKGFNAEEDEALQKLIGTWEKKTGNKIKLAFRGTDELSQAVQRAIRAGDLPDLVMTFKAERAPNARLAWEGKLADVSDVIEPVIHLYPQDILQTVNLYNNVEKKRTYYAVPIHQAANHIYYWRDLLKQVDLSDKDIPKDWDGFWQFWAKVQDKLRTKHQLNIYGLGLPLSAKAGDTYVTFEQILEAYDVLILDKEGQLQVDNLQVRQGIITVLDWYSQFYKQGYIPSDALNWLNPENNRLLLNRKLLMTTNQTLSIPAAVRQEPDTYHNKLGILEFPNKPNGQPMRNLIISDQVIIFAESPHQQIAKDFLSYLIQPKVMGEYLKSSGGRYSPVEKSLWSDPFWTNAKDPHISVATKTFTKSLRREYYTFQNPAYSTVLQENVWGKALKRVLVDGVSSEQAADETIERIKKIFAEWQ